MNITVPLLYGRECIPVGRSGILNELGSFFLTDLCVVLAPGRHFPKTLRPQEATAWEPHLRVQPALPTSSGTPGTPFTLTSWSLAQGWVGLRLCWTQGLGPAGLCHHAGRELHFSTTGIHSAGIVTSLVYFTADNSCRWNHCDLVSRTAW